MVMDTVGVVNLGEKGRDDVEEGAAQRAEGKTGEWGGVRNDVMYVWINSRNRIYKGVTQYLFEFLRYLDSWMSAITA